MDASAGRAKLHWFRSCRMCNIIIDTAVLDTILQITDYFTLYIIYLPYIILEIKNDLSCTIVN